MVVELVPIDDTDHPMAAAGAGKVVVVHSAKGGVGTTTVAVNIAADIHARGRRVCLVDLDLECGDVALALRLEPRNSILDLLAEDPDGDDAEPIDILRTTVRPGFDCILAPAQSTDPAELPSYVLGDLIPYLCAHYDAVVIDTPAAMTDHTRAAFVRADALVLVTTPEVAALRGLTVGLDRAATLGARTPFVALNHVRRGDGMPASEIAAGIGVEIAAQIPRDSGVERAGNRGEVVASMEIASDFSIAIERLVDRWCEPKQNPAKTRPLHRRRVISL
jgi:MinD-like ATPase involved in chromosome partitioning or flagellar assembly